MNQVQAVGLGDQFLFIVRLNPEKQDMADVLDH